MLFLAEALGLDYEELVLLSSSYLQWIVGGGPITEVEYREVYTCGTLITGRYVERFACIILDNVVGGQYYYIALVRKRPFVTFNSIDKYLVLVRFSCHVVVTANSL